MTEAGTQNAMLAAAQAGDDKAQCELAMMFEHGIGCAKDYAQAAKWYQAAADAGNGFAAYKLALMYENSLLTPQPDMKSASTWLRRAANAGLSEAQHKLGVMLDTGRGGEENPKEAATYLQMAADQGVADAQCRLGTLYEQGRGVPRDYVKAGQLYQAASAQNNVNAHYALGVLHVTGEGVPQNPGEALRLFTMAADAGHQQARRRLNQAKIGVSPDAEADAEPGVLVRKHKSEKEERGPEEMPDFGPAFWISSVMQAGMLSLFLIVLVLTPVGDILTGFFKAVGAPLAIMAVIGAVIALFSTLVFFKKRKEKEEDQWFKIGCTVMVVVGIALILGVIGFSKYQFTDPETAKKAAAENSAQENAAKSLMDKATRTK